MKIGNTIVCKKCAAPLEIGELTNKYTLCDFCSALFHTFLLKEGLDIDSMDYINELRRHMGLEPRVLN